MKESKRHQLSAMWHVSSLRQSQQLSSRWHWKDRQDTNPANYPTVTVSLKVLWFQTTQHACQFPWELQTSPLPHCSSHPSFTHPRGATLAVQKKTSQPFSANHQGSGDVCAPVGWSVHPCGTGFNAKGATDWSQTHCHTAVLCHNLSLFRQPLSPTHSVLQSVHLKSLVFCRTFLRWLYFKYLRIGGGSQQTWSLWTVQL